MSETNVKKSRPIHCVVTSDKMNKARIAEIDHTVKHGRYGKYVKHRSKMMFHDEKNETRVGDQVLIIPGRPRSASKRFDLLRIVKRAEQE